MRRSNFGLLLLLGFWISCNSGSSGPKYDLKGFKTVSLGGGAEYASYHDVNQWPLSTGHVINGVRNGSWTTYHPNSYKIKTVTNYINGRKNGSELEINDRGDLIKVSGFLNDELHGLTVNYNHGRTVSETRYAKGIMNGAFAVYDESNGKIQRSGSFKDGQYHGELLFYDLEGEVNMRYQYDNGVKISGGIVE